MLVAGGSTNVTTYFAMRLTADGTAATGLTITGFDLQYVRSGVAPVAKVDATALAATDSAHADNQAIEIDATDQPGLYRVDWPDAAFTAGVREVILTVKVATAFTEHLRVEIDAEVNVVEWAGTDVVAGAIPAAVADAAGGLPISDAGGLDLDIKLANTNEVTAARMGALTDWINGGRLDLIIDAILLDTGTTLDTKLNTIDDFLDTEIAAILVDTSTTLQAELDGIQADTEDIQARLPAALIGGRMDASVGAMAANVLTATAIATDAITAAKIAANAIGASELAADAATEIADAILSRDIDQVEATAALHSLTTAILKAVSRVRDNAGTLEIFRTDGVTLHMSQTVTVDATLDPVDELTAGV